MRKQKPTNPNQNLTTSTKPSPLSLKTPHQAQPQNYLPLKSVLHDTIKIQNPPKTNPQIQTQSDNQNQTQFHKTNKPHNRRKNPRKRDLGQPKYIKIHDSSTQTTMIKVKNLNDETDTHKPKSKYAHHTIKSKDHNVGIERERENLRSHTKIPRL